jgi:hypothetical protein
VPPEIYIEVIKQVYCKLAEPVFKGVRSLRDRFGFSSEREDMLRRLFGMPSLIWLQPAREHEHAPDPAEVKADHGYPHDQHAIDAIAALFPGATSEASLRPGSSIEEAVPSTDSIACSGSPVSNSFTGLYLPHWKGHSAQEPEKTLINPLRIPYHFYRSDAEPDIAVISGMRGGVPDLKRPHGILRDYGNSAPWRPHRLKDEKGQLREDFVIVSRLPRSPDGGEVLLIAGAHGAGVQAFELLFSPNGCPLSELEKLNKISAERYYQFVLEAYDIKHNKPMSEATKIRVSDDCGPVVIEPAKDLFAS